MYSIRILKPASRELGRLDKPIAKRVIARIHWLVQNVDHVKHQALQGELTGLYETARRRLSRTIGTHS